MGMAAARRGGQGRQGRQGRQGSRGMRGVLAGRRGRAREAGLGRIEWDIVVVWLEGIGRQPVGHLVKDFLSNDCVSPVSRSQMRATARRSKQNAESLRLRRRQPSKAPESRAQNNDKEAKARVRESCCSSSLPCLSLGRLLGTQPTGGEVVLKSSEATELECEGVRGATCPPMYCWYGGPP